MRTLLITKKKIFGGYRVMFDVDCTFKSEAESIELSIFQLMGQIKSFDFEQAAIDEANGVESDDDCCEEGINHIGFLQDLEGYDDGHDPEDDYYEDDEEDDEEDDD